MSETARHTFSKKERLCSKKHLDQLFGGNAKNMKAWPVRMVYLLTERNGEEDAPIEVLMSVSKRYFKRAVKRNRVKRQLREAYRLNKMSLCQLMEQRKDKKLLCAFIWTDGELHTSKVVTEKMQTLIRRLCKQIEEEPTEFSEPSESSNESTL